MRKRKVEVECPCCGALLMVTIPEMDDLVPHDMKVMRADAREILDRLNYFAGTKFRPVESNLLLIMARLREGYSKQDLGRIIVEKVREWGTDEKMSRFLRPATLFNRTNAAQYIGQIGGPDGGEK